MIQGKKNGKVKQSRSTRRKQHEEEKSLESREITTINARIQLESPPAGHNPLTSEDSATREMEPTRVLLADIPSTKPSRKAAKTSALLSNLTKFENLPISERTQKGLRESQFTHLTKVQRATIPHTLAGRDIIAEARTGSGKTLAYVIPVLENLWREQWRPQDDGLGAIILCPTRELAIQVFDVVRKVGRYHQLSAALIVGGKDYKEEQKMIGGINLLISTPGRLMHHMDTTYHFECTNLRMVVLDEADYILELGFEKQLQAILDNLPAYPQRQTLLFSATQSTAITQLARLNLHKPEVISVHQADANIMPEQLDQRYMVVPAHDKVETVYTFIKTHLRSKTIIFLNSCNQVQFLNDVFCKLRPGIVIRHMHGKMSQATRMDIYYDFCNRTNAVLLATDMVSRGLDFPNVDWVIQADCPLTTDSYVHRAGRTARFQNKGKALLLLLPSEETFVKKLQATGVTVKPVDRSLKSKRDLQSLLGSLVAENTDLKYLGQKAFISYIRSIHLAEDKSVFDLQQVDGVGFAQSLGLPGVPTIKALKGSQSHLKAMSREERAAYHEKESKRKLDKKRAKRAKELGVPLEEVVLEEDVQERMSKKLQDRRTMLSKKGHMDEVDLLYVRQNQGVLHDSRRKMIATEDQDADDDEDFMTITRRNHDLDSDLEDVVASDNDEVDDNDKFQSVISNIDAIDDDEDYTVVLKNKLLETDKHDKLREHLRVSEKHKKRKEYIKQQENRKKKKRADDQDDEPTYILGGGEGDDQESEFSDEEESEVEQRPAKRSRREVDDAAKAIEINLNESSDDEE